MKISLNSKEMLLTKEMKKISSTVGESLWPSLVAQRVKNLPAMWEAWVWSLSQEDHPKKEMPTHSSILAWRIPWIEDLVGYSPWSHKDSDTAKRLMLSLSLSRQCKWKGKEIMQEGIFVEISVAIPINSSIKGEGCAVSASTQVW